MKPVNEILMKTWPQIRLNGLGGRISYK